MVPGNFKLNTDDPKWPIELNGKFKAIRLWLDNSYTSAATGIKAAPPQSLRVVILDIGGKVLQTEDILIGRGPKDAATPPMLINFKDAAKSEALSITQGSKGPCDQRIAFTLV